MNKEKDKICEQIQTRLENVLTARKAWRKKIYMLLREETSSVYIWGIGQIGQNTLHKLLSIGVKPHAFIDNNPAFQGKKIFGLPCLSPVTLTNISDPIVFIGLGTKALEVANELQKMGIRRVIDACDFDLNGIFNDLEHTNPTLISERINACFDLLADEKSKRILLKKLQGFLDFVPEFGQQHYYHEIWQGDQYFPTGLTHFTPQEVLVDCGAYIGDTMQDFLRRKLPFQKYIAYELSRKNYDILRMEMTKVSYGGAFTLTAYNYGVGEHAEKIFYDDNISASTITETGKVPGEIVRLSDHLKGEHVSFIKMDIEGAEKSALIGGADLIRREQPKLAICVYHRISDLWELPLLMHKLEPEYKLYLRHHTPVYQETVCYSLPR